jgi:hypothetical protein
MRLWTVSLQPSPRLLYLAWKRSASAPSTRGAQQLELHLQHTTSPGHTAASGHRAASVPIANSLGPPQAKLTPSHRRETKSLLTLAFPAPVPVPVACRCRPSTDPPARQQACLYWWTPTGEADTVGAPSPALVRALARRQPCSFQKGGDLPFGGSSRRPSRLSTRPGFSPGIDPSRSAKAKHICLIPSVAESRL